ncbi:MAG: hypothetical protein ACE5GR_07035 [Nitrosopumilus sp.]
MESKLYAIFIIILLILVIPSASAQEVNIAEKAKQKSVEVIISESGEIHVKHVVSSANSPKQVKLLDGTIENLAITDEKGEEQIVTVIGNNDSVMIFPSDSDSIIDYDLKDVLLLKDNLWTLDFLYLESTIFVLPEKLDLVFVNDRAVNLGDKRGFVCHGCQMVLEYSFNIPSNIKQVNWEDKEFLVEVKTFADIENFDFNQPTKEISLEVNDNNQFITIIIPLKLLWEPYMVYLDEEKVFFNQYINNGTHVWLNMKPQTTGEITIVGTTVVPEFPIIAPLAVGFLMILILPLVRKFNLR